MTADVDASVGQSGTRWTDTQYGCLLGSDAEGGTMQEGDCLPERVRHSIGLASTAPVSYIEGIIHQGLGMTMEYVACSALPALVIERRYRPEPPDRA